MDLGPMKSGERGPQVQRSESQMIQYRDEKKPLVFTLVNGATLEGSVRWFDSEAIQVLTTERDEVTLYKHSVLYFKAK